MNDDEQVARLQAAMDTIAADLRVLFDSIQRAVQPYMPIVAALRDTYWQIYLNDGAPYGETSEGFCQWLRELRERGDE